jgi:hypothetical protein
MGRCMSQDMSVLSRLRGRRSTSACVFNMYLLVVILASNVCFNTSAAKLLMWLLSCEQMV